MDILSLITSAFGGGLTGLIGGAVDKVFAYKIKKLEIEQDIGRFAHEVEMRKADAEIMKQEWAARTKVAEVEGAAKVEVEDSKAFAVALGTEDKNYLDYLDKLDPKQDWFFVILEFIRGMIRPGLTLYLCALTTLLYLKASKLVPSVIAPDQALSMVNSIINTITYLTTTCVMFWFGSRNTEKKNK